MAAVAHALTDLELVVRLVDLDVGTVHVTQEGYPRIYRCPNKMLGPGTVDALWRLRSVHLVEWGQAQFYSGAVAVRYAGPIPVLTAAGRRLALRELG